MHIAEVVTIAKSLPLLRLNTYKSLILSYSADYRRIFLKNTTSPRRLPRIASFQSISHSFWGYLSFHFFALCVSSCRMHLASWLLFTCCLYIMLLISMAFDAFIRVLFYRHLHRFTRVNRSLHPCKQVCAPRWTCLFTRVER